MELSKKQLKQLRESYFKHNYNQEYCWGFIESLKTFGLTQEQIKIITEVKY